MPAPPDANRETDMKEIDFLPEWYRNGRRRQVSYRAQCIALGGVFVVMVVWSLAATHSLSQAQAELVRMDAARQQAEGPSVESAGLESELKQLHGRVKSVQEIDSRIDVASILAELSFLIDERIVLNKVDLVAEKFAQERKDEPAQTTGNVVRVVGTPLDDKKALPLGNVRFRVVIAGVAADAGDVGALMCKLEDSPYFWQVVLAYSRDTGITSHSAGPAVTATEARDKTAETKDNVRQADVAVRASEFEIHCYLANYQQQ